jgi:hypothetical protein
MKLIIRNTFLTTLLVLLLGCSEVEITPRDYPRLNTLLVTEITSDSVQFNAEFLFQGDFEVIQYGFVWGDNPNPTRETDNLVIASNSNSETFSRKIQSGLNNSETYYVRSFVETDDYLVYGKNVDFNFGREPIGELIFDTISPSYGIDFVELADGSIIALGITDEGTSTKSFLVKFDNHLNIEWHKVYDENVLPENGSILSSSNNGVFIAGTIFNNDQTPQSGIVKVDASGNILWTKTYLNSEGNNKIKYATNGSDGGIIAIGTSDSTFTNITADITLSYVSVLKVDENGEKEWEQKFNSESLFDSYNIEPVSDGYLFASSKPYDYSNCLNCAQLLVLTKLGPDGKKIWQTSQEWNPGIFNGWPSTVAANNQYIFVANSYRNDYQKFDLQGNFLSRGTLSMSYLQHINTTDDGGFIVAGNGDRNGFFRHKLNYLSSNGKILWKNDYGRACINNSYNTTNAKSLRNGTLLCIGTTKIDCDESNLFIAIINKKGNIQ